MVEITCRFLLFQGVFWGVHAAIFVFGYFKQKNDAELAILNSLGRSVFISRAAGLVLSVDCAMLLFGVCRNTITFLRQSLLNRWIPFEDNLYFHRWTAYSMVIFSLVHINAHYTNMFLVEYQAPQLGLGSAFEIHYEQYAGVTGHIMLLICFLMYTSAKLQVKTKNFEFFWYTHHLFIPFYICLFLHAKGCFVKGSSGCKGYGSNLGTIPFFLLYVAERLYRHYRASMPTQLTKVIFHPGNTMELRFEKDSFQYKPGQYLFLNIPSASKLQWHPFTISSTPEEGFVSVHIRIVGDWTRKAASIMGCFEKEGMSSGGNPPRIYVDGPYGAPAEDLYNYKAAILIGTGIGITPAASLLKSVWYRYYRKAPMPLKKLYFFWVNRDAEAFSWFQSLVASLEDTVPASKLEIHTYLTGKQSFDDIHTISLSHADEVDPVTELKSRTHYGRPNWRSVFKAVQLCENSQNSSLATDDVLDVGVFYCGPGALAKLLAKECEHATEGKVKFTLRKEHF